MKYDYIIVDTKLVAFQTFHRRQSILRTLPLVTRGLKFNNIEYQNSVIVWAGDIDKSLYRTTLWKEYKGHRKALQKRSSKAEQLRREDFINKYHQLHTLLADVGVNGILKDLEADDMVSIIKHLRPNASILMISLDLDWLLNVDDKTHLLFFSTNTLYTNKKQVEEKIGISPDLYTTMSALGSQAKDNILNIKQFGNIRFLKHCVDDNGDLLENYGEIIDELLGTKKYGMRVNPKAKFPDWRDNYHLNLQLMNAIPIELVDIKELTALNKRLDVPHQALSYEDFMLKCFDMYEDIPNIDEVEYKKLRNK